MQSRPTVSVAAVICVRDDQPYLESCLKHLIENGVDYAILDNGMDAAARALLDQRPYCERLLEVRTLPFTGAFELERQIEAKEALFEAIDADWLIHLDVDEAMHGYAEGERLADSIARIDMAGFNVVNFDEFVFLPVDGPYVPGAWPQPLCAYYFFQPLPGPRLMRARKKSAGLSMAPGGKDGCRVAAGHLVFGADVRLAPENLVLRHYIFRDQEHARRKYPERVYSAAELERGWHRNRVSHAPEAFALPPIDTLKRLPVAGSRAFDRSDPKARHYWEPDPAKNQISGGRPSRAHRSKRDA